MADSARIEQFRKMAEADPANVLGHYSLGQAYLEAGQADKAVASLERALELEPNLSRAYQLLGSALLSLGKKDTAIERLTQGVKTASERGDMMPRNAMTKMLHDLGAPVPQGLEPARGQQPVGEGQVLCQRCNQVKPKLPAPPFRHSQGQMIYEKICADCWREWIAMGTKVINELRLPLNDPQAQKLYDQHMLEFLNLR